MTNRIPREGWYPDPEGGPRLRWWDGTDWAERFRTRPLDYSKLISDEDVAALRTRVEAETSGMETQLAELDRAIDSSPRQGAAGASAGGYVQDRSIGSSAKWGNAGRDNDDWDNDDWGAPGVQRTEHNDASSGSGALPVTGTTSASPSSVGQPMQTEAPGSPAPFNRDALGRSYYHTPESAAVAPKRSRRLVGLLWFGVMIFALIRILTLN